jgi:hypothetical protein
VSLSIPFPNFIPATVIQSAQVNANNAAIVAYINGLTFPTLPVTIPNGGTAATTPQGALTNLGLGAGVVISTNVSFASSGSPLTITATPASGQPTVNSYLDGLTLWFQAPLSPGSGPYQLEYVAPSSTLSPVILYDSIGVNQITVLQASQMVEAVYSAVLNRFLMVNTPPPSVSTSARFILVLSGGTFVAPLDFTQGYATACAGGGGGGSGGGGFAGGGGGGGGQAINGYPFTLVPGDTYTAVIGNGGTAGSASAGGDGGLTSLTGPSGLIFSLNGGLGGTEGTSTSPASGGAAGGTGGISGQEGKWYTGQSTGGSGGGSLFGAPGAAGIGSAPGQPASGYGGGGGGGGDANGGAGSQGMMRIEF